VNGPGDAVDGTFVPVPRPSVAAVELDGETVLLEQTTGAMHLLNPVGTAVWSSLDGRRTIDGLVALLSDEAGADPGTVRRDVAAFVHELAVAGLLVEGPP
jgi:hypothetical protein